MVEGRGGEELYSSRTRTGANILCGGRAGWGGAVFLSHTYRSLLVQIWQSFWWKKVFFSLVLWTCGILARTRIRGSVPMNYGSGFSAGSGLYLTILTLLSVEESCLFDSVEDPWYFGTDPDSRISITDLRIRIFGSGSGLYRTILTLLSVEERCSYLIVLRICDIGTDPD